MNESAPSDPPDAIDVRERAAQELEAQIAAVTALTADVSAIHAALDDRELLACATGYLMCLAGCEKDDAFALLVERARTENRSVSSVAAGVLGAIDRHPHEVRHQAPTTAEVITEVQLTRSQADDAATVPVVEAAIDERAWRAGRLAACIIGAPAGLIPVWAFMNALWATGVAALVAWPIIALVAFGLAERLAARQRLR